MSASGNFCDMPSRENEAAFNPEADIGAPGPPRLIYEFTA